MACVHGSRVYRLQLQLHVLSPCSRGTMSCSICRVYQVCLGFLCDGTSLLAVVLPLPSLRLNRNCYSSDQLEYHYTKSKAVLARAIAKLQGSNQGSEGSSELAR